MALNEFNSETTTSTPPLTPELLTTEQAAALCGISVRHYESLAAAGRVGPMPIRLGRAVRWRRRELIEWIGADCPGREKWFAARQDAAGAGCG